MREPIEFEVGGARYRATRLSAMEQVHLAARIAPILTALRESAAKASALGPMVIMDAAISALNDLPPDRLESIIVMCIGTVQRQKSGDTGWAAVWNARGKLPMFDDIGGAELLAITAHVVMAEIGPFWHGLASSLSGLVQA